MKAKRRESDGDGVGSFSSKWLLWLAFPFEKFPKLAVPIWHESKTGDYDGAMR